MDFHRLKNKIAMTAVGVKSDKIAYEKRLFRSMNCGLFIMTLGITYYILLLFKDVNDSFDTCDNLYHI